MKLRPNQEGIALIISLLFLLAVSAMGLSALSRAQDENVVGSASRRHLMHVMAADAGVKLALRQLESSGGASLNTQALDVANVDGAGPGAIRIRSGTLGDPASQPIQFLQYVADPTSGGQLNLGSGNGGGGQLAIYRVNIVADNATNAAVQVQAQIAIEAPSVGY